MIQKIASFNLTMSFFNLFSASKIHFIISFWTETSGTFVNCMEGQVFIAICCVGKLNC